MNGDALRDRDSFRPSRWLRWTAVAVVAAGILYASLIDPPSSGLAPLGPLGLVGMDKWLHALAYAGLAGTLAVALAADRTTSRSAGDASTTGRSAGDTSTRSSAARIVVLALVLAIGYGISIEFAQAPLPERAFSVADMAANSVGSAVGVVGWRVAEQSVERFAPR